MTDTTLTEVKNVSRLGFTRQLQDFAYYAARTGRRFDLSFGRTHLTRELDDIVGMTSSPIHLVRLLPGG